MQRVLSLSLLAAALVLTSVPARADRDAVQFGSSIHVNADNPVHDAVCFFCSVNVEGEATGDIVVFFGHIRLDGTAHHDVVSFFSNASVADNSTVGGDMVTFFGNVRFGHDVKVAKDVVVIFGGLHAPDSTIVGKDRVVQPAWVLWIPLLVLALLIIVVVREFRAYQRRSLLRAYPIPPHP